MSRPPAQRVWLTRITVDYFEVDLEYKYANPGAAAVSEVKKDPPRHQLARQTVAWGVEQVENLT